MLLLIHLFIAFLDIPPAVYHRLHDADRQQQQLLQNQTYFHGNIRDFSPNVQIFKVQWRIFKINEISCRFHHLQLMTVEQNLDFLELFPDSPLLLTRSKPVLIDCEYAMRPADNLQAHCHSLNMAPALATTG